MSEKYSVMMDGRVPWFHRNNYPMTHDEVCETLNTQASEIAELRFVLKRMVDEFCTPHGISIFTIGDAEKALGNPSEIPNSSEVSDAAKGG